MEVISLDKKKQNKFTKRINKLKHNIKSNKKVKTDRGIIYLGHIPHGFYEEEMRSFFSQFGIVTRVKLCRSEKTGRSKGYGYVEFLHPEVAKIAAETMNNYLMFKRRVVAEYIPPEKQKKISMSKIINPNNPPAALMRNKEIRKKNRNISREKYIVQSKSYMKHLKSKLKKLEKLGIQHTVSPVNVPEESGNNKANESSTTEDHKQQIAKKRKNKSDVNGENAKNKKPKIKESNNESTDKKNLIKRKKQGTGKRKLK